MYAPYLRGKQYELILLRDNAELIGHSDFLPIIEPVKLGNINSLSKTAQSLIENGASFICIINPVHGDFSNQDPLPLESTIKEIAAQSKEHAIIGIIVNEDTKLAELGKKLESLYGYNISIIHYGFTRPKLLKLVLSKHEICHHVFIAGSTSSLYWQEFNGATKVLLEDGFQKRQTNKDYPPIEKFSDTYKIYSSYGMDAFGDFMTMSDDYSDSGGPAYAVAIHLTDLDTEEISNEDLLELGLDPDLVEPDPVLVIRHYVSNSNATASNPGAKFAEALEKLIADLESGIIRFQSSATDELKKLHQDNHYPGLGYLKKLSMQHHLELMKYIIESGI